MNFYTYEELVPKDVYRVETHPNASTPYGVIYFPDELFRYEDLKRLYENGIPINIQVNMEGKLHYSGTLWVYTSEVRGAVYGWGNAKLVDIDACFEETPQTHGMSRYALTFLDGPQLYLADASITSCTVRVWVGDPYVSPNRRIPLLPRQSYPASPEVVSVEHFCQGHDLVGLCQAGTPMKVELNYGRSTCQPWCVSGETAVAYGYGNPAFATQFTGDAPEVVDNGQLFAIVTTVHKETLEPIQPPSLCLNISWNSCSVRAYYEVPYQIPTCPNCGSETFNGYQCWSSCEYRKESATAADLMILANECGASYETIESLWGYLCTRKPALTSEEYLRAMEMVADQEGQIRWAVTNVNPDYRVGSFSDAGRRWLWHGIGDQLAAMAGKGYEDVFQAVLDAASHCQAVIDVVFGENPWPYLKFLPAGEDVECTIVYGSQYGNSFKNENKSTI